MTHISVISSTDESFIIFMCEAKTEILFNRGKRFFVELFHGRDGKVVRKNCPDVMKLSTMFITFEEKNIVQML